MSPGMRIVNLTRKADRACTRSDRHYVGPIGALRLEGRSRLRRCLPVRDHPAPQGSLASSYANLDRFMRHPV